MKKNIEPLLGTLQSIDFKGEMLYYYKHISALQEALHQQIPKENFNTARAAVSTDIREEVFQGKNYNRAVMYLLSNGCQWALKNGNGCTMCGHLAKQTRQSKRITAEEFIQQFRMELKKIDFSQYPLLNLYNNGSILNEEEIPPEALKEILKMINRQHNIKMLVLETRPEFVSEKKIKEIKHLVPDKHVEIAVGLEIKDDLLRTVCINKGFSLNQYQRAADIITRYLNLRTYVLLKPPFLTEKEAVDNAVETIKYAFAMGSNTVSLEACTIQDYTLVKYLADNGLYKTPWLWSILEVIKGAAGHGKLVIGLFQFFPSPLKVPYNCHRCSSAFMETTRQYNRTLDVGIFDRLTCRCKTQWEKEIKKEHPTFQERLKNILCQLPTLKTGGQPTAGESS